MKRILLAFVIVTLMTINGFAQYKPFQFGLSFTPTICTTKSNCDIIKDGKSKLSYNFGFRGNFYFVENYGFQTGFNFKNIKGEYTFNDSLNMPTQMNISNQYFEIPLGLMMRTENIGKFRISGTVSYGLGILLKPKPTDEFSKIRNAFIIKLGFDYNIYKSSCLSVALVYDNNFTNIFKRKNSLGHDVSLSNFGLEIGFVF